MATLSNFGQLGKDKVQEMSFCETCTLAKQHRLKFPKGVHTPQAILDYVHAALWGLKVRSLIKATNIFKHSR